MRFLLTLVLAVFLTVNLNAQKKQRGNHFEGALRVKIKPELVDHFDQMHKKRGDQRTITANTNEGFVKTGIEKLDKINKKVKSTQYKRVFRHGGKFEERHREFGLHLWYEIEFNNSYDLQTAIEAYQKTGDIEIAEKVYAPQLFEGTVTNANDPKFSQQWNYANIKADAAWKHQTGSTQVVVAIEDGGIDVDHEDLAGNMWINNGEIPNNGVDDDNNGYVDDYNGYNFGDNKGEIEVHYHGCHVAGTVAAETNNGIGVAGVAGGNGNNNGIRLMSCTVFGKNNNDGFDEAFIYAADMGAVISQNSWGGGEQSQSLENAIDYFIANAGGSNEAMQGGIVIFAAGNSNTDSGSSAYPANLSQVVAVSSVDKYDKKSSFSNYGSWVDIAAPGSDILSSYPDDGYNTISGTSMACPHVSGVAALVVSQYYGSITAGQLRDKLVNTTDPIDYLNPNYTGKLGSGRLNALKALGLTIDEYCVSKGQNASYEWIESVTIGNYSKTSGTNSGYGDFTGTTVNLTAGQSYNLSLAPGFGSSAYNEYWKIWIDYNKNKEFESDELVFDSGSASSSTVNGTLSVSPTAEGTTRMRVSMKYNGAPTACESFEYGEVEDYNVNIQGGTPNYSVNLTAPSQATVNQSVQFSGTASAGIAYIKVTIDGYEIASETVSNGNFAFNYAFNTAGNNRVLNTKAYNSNNEMVAEDTDYISIVEDSPDYFVTISAPEQGIVGMPVNFTGTSSNEVETVIITVDGYEIANLDVTNGSYEFSYSFNTTGNNRQIVAKAYIGSTQVAEAIDYISIIEDDTPTYCSSSASNDSYEWIDLVQLGNINNSSGADGGYADNTNLSTNLTKGSEYTLYISAGYSSSAYNEYWRVWIDYNLDGDFDDAGEKIAEGITENDNTYSLTFTVPTAAVSGDVRMRVSMQYNEYAEACGSFTYGEVEDYTIIISGTSSFSMFEMPQQTHTNLLKDAPLEISLYPNPARNNVSINGVIDRTSEIKIYNMTGKLVKMINAANCSGTIDVNNLETGVYLVKVFNGRKYITTKFTKQ